MSLLDDFGRLCVLLEKSVTLKPEGGFATVWKDGVEFMNYQSMDSSMEARIAEQQGVTSIYSALVDSALPIDYNDYFRDKESGTIFRVTSRPDEKKAPKSASFQLKYFSAERTVLPE